MVISHSYVSLPEGISYSIILEQIDYSPISLLK
jgi:hypothetical protein